MPLYHGLSYVHRKRYLPMFNLVSLHVEVKSVYLGPLNAFGLAAQIWPIVHGRPQVPHPVEWVQSKTKRMSGQKSACAACM